MKSKTRIVLHENKKQLIALMKNVNIGIIEKYSQFLPSMRKWSLSFYRLNNEAPTWFQGKNGERCSLFAAKVYGRDLDDLYEKGLLTAFKTWMYEVVWDNSALEIVTLEDIRNSSEKLTRHIEYPFHELKLRTEKLIDYDISNCSSIEEVFLVASIA